MELHKAISAILFYQAEPSSVGKLAKLLKKNEGEVRDALVLMEEKFAETGLRLIRNGDEVTLGTAPEAGELIETITKEELSRELSKASLETLAIVLYKGPITRSEIDYVRGVNSTFILRNLQIRNLVERIENPEDQRSFLYKPTFQLLEYMGVTKIEELPDYHTVMATLNAFKEQQEKEEEEEETVDERAGSPEEKLADEVSAVEETLVAAETAASADADAIEEDEAGEGFRDDELNERLEEEHTQTP